MSDATREQELAEAYTAARPRLVRVAYAVLGTRVEAEDVVSDCWFRLVRADASDPVRDVEAWAVTAVARAALDVLRSARHRRERYTGPWLPEPVVEERGTASDPADRVSLDESVSYALLVVLESLSPAERTAWVLHDLFGVPFGEVAQTVGRSPAAVRQLAARARAHVAERAPRSEVDRRDHERVVGRFLDAAVGGDLDALVAALDPAVVLTSDGGGLVTAARRPVRGADKVARFLRGVLIRPGRTLVRLRVNGDPALGVLRDGVLDSVQAFGLESGRVVRIDVVRSPEKLRAPGQTSRLVQSRSDDRDGAVS